ncbi:MAG: NifU family protein [Actinomycetota bacterium]|jgi:Fe-S cluster biogenesis protein NfuA/nitrite reductase/ring-hydroxylating ferredoxin subunit|nr:NifU family protein [Actinomycetota bacterium]
MAETEAAVSRSEQLRATGERIDALLDASSSGGVVARERAEELVRLVADLYGAGLERVLTIVDDSGHLDDDVLAALAADDVVASLLLVHGLHPYDVTTRVEQALEGVRPYLGSHGGDVELLEVSDEGVVRLRLLGSCDGCPSSSVTLKLAVEGAIEAAAPEITTIQVDDPTEDTSVAVGPVISIDSLRSRIGGAPAVEEIGQHGSSWEVVPGLAELSPGGVAGFVVAETSILGCRIDSDLFAFLDRCARCEATLAGATLSRRLGGAIGDAVLRCPTCQAHYEVRRAGACLDATELHLDPLPLLVSGDVVSVAIPASVTA